MQPALLQALAFQRAAQLPVAALNGHRRPAASSRHGWMVRQRIGWALVHAGLRLVVARERA